MVMGGFLTEELVLYAAQLHPNSDGGTTGGAINPYVRLTFTPMAANDDVEVLSDSALDAIQSMTIRARTATGDLVSETKLLTGTTPVVFALLGVVDRIEEALLSGPAAGVVTLRRSVAGSTICTIPSGELGIRRLFSYAYPDPLAAKTYYEKGFLKNNSTIHTLAGMLVVETSDPEGLFTFTLAASQNDSATTPSGRLSSPIAADIEPDTFDASSKAIPGADLAPGDAIGVWFKLTAAAAEAPFKNVYEITVTGTGTGSAVEEPPAVPPVVSLVASGPIVITTNNQVVEGLDITATGAIPGIRVENFTGCIIRNCRIRHAAAHGIEGGGTLTNLLIEDCEIECTAVPATGEAPGDDRNNIELITNSTGIIIRRVRLRKGSSGIYIQGTANGILCENLEGYDFRGPFPRGQLVQYNGVVSGIVQDFSCINIGNVSWPEDLVNMFATTNCIVRRGFLRGNSSPSGQCVIFENSDGGSGGLCEDVDGVFFGNGGFMAGPASSGVIFRRCRARDGIDLLAESGNVGATAYDGSSTPSYQSWLGSLFAARGSIGPLSGSEAFFEYQSNGSIQFDACKYFNLPGGESFIETPANVTLEDIASLDFTPNAPIVLTFDWES